MPPKQQDTKTGIVCINDAFQHHMTTGVMLMKQQYMLIGGQSPPDSDKLHEEVVGGLAIGLSGVHGSQRQDCRPLGCLVARGGILLEVLNHLVHLQGKLVAHLHGRVLHHGHNIT